MLRTIPTRLFLKQTLDISGEMSTVPRQENHGRISLYLLVVLIDERVKMLQLQGPLTSLVAQMVKCPPTMWETWLRSLGQEDPLEKEMATHSSTLAWEIPRTEECGGLQPTGSQRVGHN